ncbi:Spo0B domain-containing protein [Alicyclobacillus fodiniaquatilis]|uniref:Spo0B domain-containing protein n=1 Tax=Alicyclobacillus fodiniaquatilis TaxID=1661150 RepID=A0ABW4JFA3_9BACL
MLSTDSDEFNATSFRRHRHDVLNQLQLVRAYLQMERTEDAITMIDQTAQWLQSLALWQINFGYFGERLMWVAATCPNVYLKDVASELELTDECLTELEAWLVAVQHLLAQQGGNVYLSISAQGKGFAILLDSQAPNLPLEVWHNTYETLHFNTL